MTKEDETPTQPNPKIAVKEFVRREAGIQNVPTDAPDMPDHAPNPEEKGGGRREHAADRGARNKDSGEHEDDKS